MSAARPILVAFDGHAFAALRLARWLSELLELPLHVATAYRYEPISLSSRQEPDWASEQRREVAERRMDRAMAWGEEPHEVEHSVIATERIADGLLELARELDASAMVLGPDQRGDVTNEVIRRAACPVAVAPEEPLLVESRPRVVGVAFDGSSAGRLALLAAGRLADRAGARFEAVVVADDDSTAHEMAHTAELSAESETRTPHVVRRRGSPGAALRRACEGLDVLVCGSHGRWPLIERDMGNVVAELIDAPICPMIVIPERARPDRTAALGIAGAGHPEG
ncbi:MAG TPA: universal stress protein [Solirubrobacteraceae bacterium]|nr:universal stress protein [Solirubrobacteraceae bacterium]